MVNELNVRDSFHAIWVGLGVFNASGFAFAIWLVKRHIRRKDDDERKLASRLDQFEAVQDWHGQRLIQVETRAGLTPIAFTASAGR